MFVADFIEILDPFYDTSRVGVYHGNKRVSPVPAAISPKLRRKALSHPLRAASACLRSNNGDQFAISPVAAFLQKPADET
jgi:hypothetical protein